MTLTAPQLSAIGNFWDKNGETRYYVNNIQKLIPEKIPEDLRVYVDSLEEIHVVNCYDRELKDKIKAALTEQMKVAADMFVIQFYSSFGKEAVLAEDMTSAERMAQEIWESYPKSRQQRMGPVKIFEPGSNTSCKIYPGRFSVETFTREEYTKDRTTNRKYFDRQEDALVYGLRRFRDLKSKGKYYVHIKEKDLVIKAYAPDVPE